MNERVQLAILLAEKIRQITDEVLVRNIGRQEMIKVSWVGLISGRPAFFLGPTGVNKTATIRQIARRIEGARFDERLIPAVRSFADLFVEATEIRERDIEGGRATSLHDRLGLAALTHIFFGDEFFKDEDHPVLNALIDFALEGLIRHDGATHKTPLMFFTAAGNEVPDSEGKLAAVWSRMSLRLMVNPLNRGQKKSLVTSRLARYQEQVTGEQGDVNTLMSLDDLQILRDARPFVVVPDKVVDTVLDVYDDLAGRSDADFTYILGDDRRFGRVFDAMQALALMAGRESVTSEDLQALRWMLWDEPGQIPVLSEVLAEYTRTPLSEAQELVNALLSPTGAVEAVGAGDVGQATTAISQAKAAIGELDKLADEARGDDKREIEQLKAQVQEKLQSVINKSLGI